MLRTMATTNYYNYLTKSSSISQAEYVKVLPSTWQLIEEIIIYKQKVSVYNSTVLLTTLHHIEKSKSPYHDSRTILPTPERQELLLKCLCQGPTYRKN